MATFIDKLLKDFSLSEVEQIMLQSAGVSTTKKGQRIKPVKRRAVKMSKKRK